MISFFSTAPPTIVDAGLLAPAPSLVVDTFPHTELATASSDSGVQCRFMRAQPVPVVLPFFLADLLGLRTAAFPPIFAPFPPPSAAPPAGAGHTASKIFPSTPSAFILCLTASAGTFILSILLNLPATASSSSVSLTGAFAAGGGGIGNALALLPPPPPPESGNMILTSLSSHPSILILCSTACLGTFIFSIVLYFLSAFLSSSLSVSSLFLSLLFSPTAVKLPPA
jgi:hypothetical protein